MAKLEKSTVEAFDGYIRAREERLQQRLKGKAAFLWVDESSQRRALVSQGEVAIEAASENPIKAADGLIHDWTAAIFVPRATLEKSLALVRDYGNYKTVYQPEIIDSRLLSRAGNHDKVYLRLTKSAIVTVVFNTEHDVTYVRLDKTRWSSRVQSTRVAEVENAGGAAERELPAGEDNGYLWRLNSYWRFEQREGGIYIECEAISLTRQVMAGLHWLIDPIIEKLPKQSLLHTLRCTSSALGDGIPAGQEKKSTPVSA